MTTIAPTAIVERGCELADNVIIGPGAIIESGCEIGTGCEIGAYSIINGGTRLGENNLVSPFCSLGGEPQDKKYNKEKSTLVIGNGNTIREYCFFNRGTKDSGNQTQIGDNNWIMAYVHVAHDCTVGDNTVIANAVQFAGHVHINHHAVIGGGVLMAQFRHVGDGAMVGGGEQLRLDVPPYAWCSNGIVAVNSEGMRRRGFATHEIENMKQAFRLLYRSELSITDATDAIRNLIGNNGGQLAAALTVLVDFLTMPNLRLLRPAR